MDAKNQSPVNKSGISQRRLLLALALASTGMGSAFAQSSFDQAFTTGNGAADPLSFSRTADRLAALRHKYREEQPYNIHLGPVNLSFSASATAEYNDNINLANRGKVSDFDFGPDAKVNALWVVSEQNALSIDGGFGYRYYFKQSSVSSLTVAPDSNISFDIVSGHFLFNVHNRTTYAYDPISVGTFSNVEKFARLQNTTGVTAFWDSGDLNASLGYDHVEYIAISKVFSNLSHSDNVVFGTVGYDINDANTLSLEAGNTWVSYEKSLLNSGYILSVGPAWKSKITDYISIGLHGGLTYQNYDNKGTIKDGSNYAGYYASLVVDHRLSSSMSYSLDLSHSTELGTSSNFVDLYTARADFKWIASDRITFGVPIGYEYGQESTYGAGGERFGRWITGANVTCALGPKTSATLAYMFVSKNSQLLGRDYEQNTVSVTLDHKF